MTSNMDNRMPSREYMTSDMDDRGSSRDYRTSNMENRGSSYEYNTTNDDYPTLHSPGSSARQANGSEMYQNAKDSVMDTYQSAKDNVKDTYQNAKDSMAHQVSVTCSIILGCTLADQVHYQCNPCHR